MNNRKNTTTIMKYILDAIGYIGSILYLLNWFGILQEPLFRVDFLANYYSLIAVLALLIFFLCTLWLGYRIHAWHKRQEEKVKLPARSSKKLEWTTAFSFRRSPLFDENQRIKFFTTVVSVEIILVIGIYVFLSLYFSSSSSLPKTVSSQFLVMTILSVSIMTIGVTLTTWVAIAELYAIRESKRQLANQIEIDYLNSIKRFKRALRNVQDASDPDVKTTMLSDFQDQLRNLCYNYEWNRVKDEIGNVLNDIIPDKLFQEPYAKWYTQYLAMIINRFGEYVIDRIDKKWSKEIEKFYDAEDFDTDSISNIFQMLLQLHKYSKEYLMQLIDDVATRWSELKFQVLMGNFGTAFDELRKSDEKGYEEIIIYLRRRMEDAKRDKDKAHYVQLEKLFWIANK